MADCMHDLPLIVSESSQYKEILEYIIFVMNKIMSDS